MERRSALKNMGLAFGYAVATPTLLSVLQSCKEKAPYAEWVPSFLEKDKGFALAQTLDIILPKTDTPSATEMNVHTFIDTFIEEVLEKEQQDFVLKRMDMFFSKIQKDAGKETIADLTPEDIEPALKMYLRKRTEEEEEIHSKAISGYMEAIMQGGEATLEEDVANFSFANDIRDMATFAYKNSEYIGEEVLAYLPIPGEYIACGNVNELTNNKAWSL
ncbi:gluconate 2-dehydrogenase subunit 3 family protein [Flavobacterium sp. ASW18X]|uniref:gluconate 2-dehydrogenase subunit 3 family protein n=1 Tax=Flavobacterium sp. ASW18X TaxID=2572595 RepID=UPI0010AE4253|nr:gluconate 2-dehydrogenase subunit 3 family protein [Flavobacterium sp. ASW18X]TKD67265.1 gluconate 2-dehydrogenase subunit 3 family protein [Flavobacterium sp. ASW18X]